MKVDDKLLKQSLDLAIDFSVREKEGHKPKKRNFDESVDLIINLKDIDLNDPKQRIDKELILPNPVAKERKSELIVIATGELLLQAKKMDVDTMDDEELDRLNAQEKKDKKKLVKKYKFFIVQDRLMPTVARYLARFLGPRGKMPKPFPDGYGIISSVEELENAINRYKRIIRIQVKKTPMVQVKVGKKSMEMKEIFENIETVVDYIVDQMPHKYNNIRNMYIKTTMGKPVKVDEEFLEEKGE
ncbi:MAG: 50S ribosomal protein L1 [Promethearchaeota archaeon]|jgi:large subunit ribosomal protein L1|nr:MAG: 50S ribosomal protein L1 [Candidatus Lokiarchaeota archaeon]